MRFQDGKIKHLSVYAEPLYEDGDVRGCIGVLIDSTDYRIAIAALAEADRRKDQFLALLAHKLRNPLTPLVAAADLLERDGATPQVIERLRHALVNQTRHLWRLVDDLLDVSRVVHDRMELHREPLDLCRALRDAVATAWILACRSAPASRLLPISPAWKSDPACALLLCPTTPRTATIRCLTGVC